METVAILHGNLEVVTNYFRNKLEKDTSKKPCWSRLKITPDGLMAWFGKGKNPDSDTVHFLGQVMDLELIKPPHLTVWRNGIRYWLDSAARGPAVG